MAQPTAQEQYFLELVNRARLKPTAEAARYNINLNQGLPSGTISSTSKQPLAFNFNLIDASRSHSQWMLNTDTFSHTGAGGSSAGQRMTSAGYDFTGSWTWGENIAWQGTTGTPNVTASVTGQHEGLFKSSGHRRNILNGSFREIGIGTLTGEFDGYNAVMTTQNFAKSGNATFLTGVAFDDGVTDDDFYTVGEGLGGINVTATRQSDNATFRTTTFGSGGYQVALTPGTYNITFSGGELAQAIQQTVTVGSKNVKLDLATDDLPTSGGTAPSGPPSNPPTGGGNPSTIGEYGKVSLNHQWRTVTLDDTYRNPVVIVSDPTFNGGDPVATRLRNVTGNSFQIRLQEPNYKDGNHTNETVAYVVMEAGDWELADGTQISAGQTNSNRLSSDGFDRVDLTGFDNAPTVLTQVQTDNGSDWVTTRVTGQSATRFSLVMQEEEALNNGAHARETLGWLAIAPGVANDGDTLLQGGTTGRSYTHNRATVNFDARFNMAPSLIAKLGSFYGPDPANLRLDSIGKTSFGVRVAEEQSLDAELNHTQESVAFLALEGSSGSLSGLAA
ncbi:MAG: CAP domain-containing protein [Cyanobacteria bacterium P01_D01_bin.71]